MYKERTTNAVAACAACFVLLAGAPAFASVPPIEQSLTNAVTPIATVPLKWLTRLEDGLALAGTEYRPVLLLFSSETCPWCKRLKQEVLSAPALRDMLEEFVVVELDVAANQAAASVYQVRGVPAVRILASDGRVQSGFSGYATVEQMRGILKEALNPVFMAHKDRTYVEITAMLSSGTVPSNRWADVMTYLGDRDRRDAVRAQVIKLEPFPFEPVVALLKDERLAVRLGALEILEELTGRTCETDPWNTDAEARREAVTRWRTWCRGATNTSARTYAALTEEQLRGYIQDLISSDRERSVRALDMIQRAGPTVLPSLEAFLAETPDLPEGARRCVKEACYAVQLDAVEGVRPAELAHRLLFGTLDIQLKTLGTIALLRQRALPVLREFLEHENPLVRETAVDGLTQAGGWHSIDAIRKHLETEKDADVIYACLKAVGHVEHRRGVKVLLPFLSSDNEDLVIVALQGLAKVPSRQSEPGIVNCLADKRWRVRATALETIAKLELRGYDSKLSAMLSDPDEAVRCAAALKLVSLGDPKGLPVLAAGLPTSTVSQRGARRGVRWARAANRRLRSGSSASRRILPSSSARSCR